MGVPRMGARTISHSAFSKQALGAPGSAGEERR